jgi:hypothetical protein
MNPLIVSTLKDFHKVYFQASDPGAFSIMEPVFEAGVFAGIDCEWILEGWCASAKFGKMDFTTGLDFIEKNSWADFSGSCILQGTRVDYKREREWIDFARKTKLYSIVFFDYWHNYSKNFYDPEASRMHLPDKIWIMDELADGELKRELERLIDRKCLPDIEIVGHPGIEKIKTEIENFSQEKLLALKNRYNPSNKKVILLALEPLRKDNRAENIAFDEFDVIRRFFRELDRENVKALVRPHPRQSLEEIAPLADREAKMAGVEYEYVGNDSMNDLLAVSDEVIGTTSTTLVIALKLGIPIKSLMPGAGPEVIEKSPNIVRPFICV